MEALKKGRKKDLCGTFLMLHFPLRQHNILERQSIEVLEGQGRYGPLGHRDALDVGDDRGGYCEYAIAERVLHPRAAARHGGHGRRLALRHAPAHRRVAAGRRSAVQGRVALALDVPCGRGG